MRSWALLWVCLPWSGAEACRITLHAHSEVVGPTIRLSDIADIECAGDTQLPHLSLGDAAHFGLTRMMDVERIQTISLAPWFGKMVLVAPGRTIQVTTAADTLAADVLAAKVDSVLNREILSPRMSRTIQVLKSPQAITLPKGSRTVDLVFTGLKRRGKVPLELRIGKEGHVVRKIPIVADVRVVGPVAVATTLVRRGELFSPQNIREEMRDITNFSAQAVPTLADCLGKLASQTVVSGRMLTLRLVNIPPVFQKGESVPLVLQAGSVHVAIQAVARRDGHVGEVIPVWNPVNRRMVHALVQKDGTLKLMAEGG